MDWQADIKTPIADNLVTRFSNFMTRVLVSTNEDYFTVDHPTDEEKSQVYAHQIATVLRDNRFPIEVFSPSIARGLINSVYCNKVVFTAETRKYPTFDPATGTYDVAEEIVSRTRILPINPRHIRLDPEGDRYIIEICPQIPYHEYQAMARTNQWSNNKKIADTIKEEVAQTAGSQFLPTVTVRYVYTRALTNISGETLLEDVMFVVVNDDIVVHLEKNILPDGEFPYVVENPLQSLFGRYGRSYLAKNRSIMVNYIESMNLLMDAFRLSALGIYEYDIQAASQDAAHVFTAGLVPGQFYPKTGSGTVLRGVFNNSLQNSAGLQVVSFLDRELQNRSFQNEFFMGAPTSKGRPTFGEVSLKTEETNTFFTDIASYMEDRIIQRILWLVIVTELIYMSDKTKVDLIQDVENEAARSRVQSLSFTERMEDVRRMTLAVRGISGKIRRLNSFNRFIQVFNVMGNIPGALQNMRSDQVLEKIFEVIDDTPDEFFNLGALIGNGLGAPPEQPPEQPPAPQQPPQTQP